MWANFGGFSGDNSKFGLNTLNVCEYVSLRDGIKSSEMKIYQFSKLRSITTLVKNVPQTINFHC